jgi:hypothetical protein
MKLYEHFFDIFVLEKDLTWREFFLKVVPSSQNYESKDIELMCEIVVHEQWSRLTPYQKSFLVDRKIVAID